MNPARARTAREKYAERFGAPPEIIGHAPGRIEALGNHTDYNEGFTLSAAINFGVMFAAGPHEGRRAAIRAADLNEETELLLPVSLESARAAPLWAKYVAGVIAKLAERGCGVRGFNALISGDVPLGSGLSSSAALEVSAAMALTGLFGFGMAPLDMALACQAAENEFTGARCGLLDQFSSLFGEKDSLVLCDFREKSARTVPLGHGARFLIADTGVRHSLVNSEYNARRQGCAAAADYFAGRLARPVRALRDVSMEDWERLRGGMDAVEARRALHIIGENERVLKAVRLLEAGDLRAFGKLMFDSHASSRENFENSCPELDVLVEAAARSDAILGARLSGGGFGGSAAVLVDGRNARAASDYLAAEFVRATGRECLVREVAPSGGAGTIRCG